MIVTRKIIAQRLSQLIHDDEETGNYIRSVMEKDHPDALVKNGDDEYPDLYYALYEGYVGSLLGDVISQSNNWEE